MPFRRLAPHFVAFVHADLARIAEPFLFMPVQPGVSLRSVRHVGRRAHRAVNQSGTGADPEMGLHPKVPGVSWLNVEDCICRG